MKKIHEFIIKRKLYFIPIVALGGFLLLRTVLLANPPKELLYTVKRENLVDTVQVSGTYATASQTQVTSPTNGIITKLYIVNKQQIKKGDPLFYVESTATVDQQNTAHAQYLAAVNALQSAQNNKQSLDATMWTQQQSYLAAQNAQNYKNNNAINPSTKQNYTDLEKLAIDNAVVQTQKSFTAAEQAYKTADVAVSASQAKVTETKRLYDETKSALVTAPASGQVVNFMRQIGDQVSAPQSTVTSAIASVANASSITPPVLVIANLGNPVLIAAISEDYALRVLPDQKVSIVFDALRTKTFYGKIATIDTVGTQTQGIVTYNVRIASNDLPTIIKPNMTALLTIETLRKDNIIDVPTSAIHTKDGETYVVEAKTHKQLPVTLGTKGIAKTEIISGLAEGTVIVANTNSN